MTASARPAGPAREVRIIGGRWKRSKLPVADVPGLRPTPDRVRETLFNWLGNDLSGWRCLDAFAGSGALGFEAASRNAASVTMLERHTRQVRSLLATQQRLGAELVRIEAADAMAFMRRAEPRSYELVFIDPPFDADMTLAALASAAPLLVPQGFVYVEASKPLDDAMARALGLALYRQAKAGIVHFHLLRPQE